MSDQPNRTAVPPLIVTEDNQFWFEAAREGRLLIQRCADCGTLRHPPTPTCAECRCFDWETVESTRQGTLLSYTVVHHPQDAAFNYPVAVGLVDLAEGTRLLADIADVDLADIRVGMPVEVGFAEHAHGAVLPQLIPTVATEGTGRAGTDDERTDVGGSR